MLVGVNRRRAAEQSAKGSIRPAAFISQEAMEEPQRRQHVGAGGRIVLSAPGDFAPDHQGQRRSDVVLLQRRVVAPVSMALRGENKQSRQQ